MWVHLPLPCRPDRGPPPIEGVIHKNDPAARRKHYVRWSRLVSSMSLSLTGHAHAHQSELPDCFDGLGHRDAVSGNTCSSTCLVWASMAASSKPTGRSTNFEMPASTY